MYFYNIRIKNNLKVYSPMDNNQQPLNNQPPQAPMQNTPGPQPQQPQQPQQPGNYTMGSENPQKSYVTAVLLSYFL